MRSSIRAMRASRNRIPGSSSWHWNAWERRPTRPCTSAICFTSTSSAPEPRALLRCCSTSRICTARPIVCAYDRCPRWSTCWEEHCDDENDRPLRERKVREDREGLIAAWFPFALYGFCVLVHG